MEKVLRPCLTSSSERMSKLSKTTFSACSISVICREKPQRGASGLPFMKSITGERLTRAASRASRGSAAGVGSAPVLAAELGSSVWMLAVIAFSRTLPTRSGALAPMRVSVSWPACKKRNAGTDSISKRSHSSGN